jgi:cobalt-zinc-cadmium resistance protein CzcA
VLPKDVKVVPFYDRSDLIHLTARTVAENLTLGILLVGVVLIFFLFDVRAGLIAAVAVPLSLLVAFIGLDLQHIPANLLSTAPSTSAFSSTAGRDGREHLSTVGAAPREPRYKIREVILVSRHPRSIVRSYSHSP